MPQERRSSRLEEQILEILEKAEREPRWRRWLRRLRRPRFPAPRRGLHARRFSFPGEHCTAGWSVSSRLACRSRP